LGILSASVSLTRYRIVEKVPDNLWPNIPDLLIKHSFQEIENSAEERSFGWTCLDDMLDTNWETAAPKKGSYLTFALRLDTRRVPPAVLKKHYTLELEKLKNSMQEQGKKFVSKEQKKELKDQVRLKLLAKTLPVPAQFDVFWNVGNNRVYLASTTDKIRQMFEELFTQSFELHLEAQDPYFLALNELGAERSSELNSFEPSLFV
jgi:DNA recombination-dependent growth factor C